MWQVSLIKCLVCTWVTWIHEFLSGILRMSFVCLELFEGKDSFFCKFMLLSNFCLSICCYWSIEYISMFLLCREWKSKSTIFLFMCVFVFVIVCLLVYSFVYVCTYLKVYMLGWTLRLVVSLSGKLGNSGGRFGFRFGLQPVLVWEFNPNGLQNYFGSVRFQIRSGIGS